MQRALGQLGYSGTGQTPLTADGVFCANTLHAVQAFQRGHALDVDGKVGPSTDAAIDEALAAHRTTGLQSGLNRFGYTDSDGRPLQVDGDFGAQTRFAVEAFQRDHHLSIDGKVAPRTQGELDAALTHRAQSSAAPTNPPLSDPRNPDNPLYRQALAQVQKIDADMGRRSDEHGERLAAALVSVAKAHGLTRIDAVALSDDGSRTFVAQETTPVRRMADVSTAEAVRPPSSGAASTCDRCRWWRRPPPIRSPGRPPRRRARAGMHRPPP
ncbi:peptidoglycan-binding domain-containing protein [Dyella lutea]|uniref:peptidoglycan-binding domain-containing protein n=1 Tax=Dyella lutea TaxID=2950441 RepID=UPI00211325D4|nr:peptidoglycan-binding protein [Dyella lutea]